MARLGDLIVTVGADTRSLNTKLGQVQKQMRGTFNNIQKMGVGMSAAVTAPLAAIAARSFGVAADFEQSMAKVAAVSGATGKQFAALERDALRLGSATRFTATEVSGLQLEFAKLGFTSDEITKVTESTLALAQASGSDLARSAEVAGATLRGFGLDAEETGRVTDVMAASFSGTALDMESFAESMKYVAPVAKSAGLSIEQTTALLGTLANAGIKGGQAGTALRRIISELGATGGDVSKAIENLAQKGLNLADAKDEVGRSAQSALLVLSKNTAITAELTEAFEKAEGKAKAMAAVMDDTARGALARMQSAIEGAQISLGEQLAPMVEKLAGFVADLASKIQKMSPEMKRLVINFGLIAGALGPILLALPLVVRHMQALSKIISLGGFGVAVAAFAAIAVTVASLRKEVVTINDRLEKAQKRANEQASESIAMVRILVGEYKDEATTLERKNEILNELKQTSKTYFGDLEEGKSTVDDLTAATDNYVESIKEQARQQALMAAQQDQLNAIAEEQKRLLDLEIERQQVLDKLGLSLDNMGSAHARVEAQQRVGFLRGGALIEDLNLLNAQIDVSQNSIDDMGQALIDFAQTFGLVIPSTQQAAKAVEHLGTSTSTAQQQFTTLEDIMRNWSTEGRKYTDKVLDGIVEIEEEIEDVEFDLDFDWQKLADKMKRMRDFVVDITKEIENAIQQGVSQALVGMGEAIAQMLSGGLQGAQLMAKALQGLGDFMKQIGSAMIAQAAAMITFQKSLFKNPYIAAAAGVAFVAAGALLSNYATKLEEGQVALAKGGLAYGPTSAIVGDNPNARMDPEVIAPLSKLQDIMGSGNVQVFGRISGSDILLSNERARRDRNRYS